MECEDGPLCVCVGRPAATGKRKKPPGRKRRRKKARGSNASDKMTDSDALLLDIETARKDLTFLNQSDQSKETDNAVEIEGRRRDRTRFNDRLKGLKLSEICASPVYIPQISRLLEDSIEADPKPVDDLPVEDPDLPDSSPKTDNVYELEEEDDNDEDLPDVLTPVKPDVSAQDFQEGHLVWVKRRPCMFLPALVMQVNKMGLRVELFNEKQEKVSLSYRNKKNLLPYHPAKREILKSIESLPKADQEYFKTCVHRVNDFLMQRERDRIPTSHQLSCDTSTTELKPDGCPLDDSPYPEAECDASESASEGDGQEEAPGRKGKTREPRPKDILSKKGEERLQKIKEKNENLLQFLLSEKMKVRLKMILRGKQPSTLHDIYTSGSMKERKKIMYRGFGPIENEDQIDHLVNCYLDLIRQMKLDPLKYINYVLDVWIPEAVIYGLTKLKGYGKKKAEEMFNKGVRRTKEEIQVMRYCEERHRERAIDTIPNLVLQPTGT
ncbi:PWWP domain-containing DNA repair factor 3A-like isoform X2 [Mya arenaria]|uniref:PWWP domain-containing DNA repair factor 3A-like isoform X2 n=1 Tax=Mya arenaria TaxID=6604 RepID=UPI0022E173C4|nr:PWWP domain-containing DNA repair factor 3A-like isoform X2 [Mya arenaria]